MGIKNIYERFIWFDSQVRGKKYPNTTSLANQFEISTKTAQRDIDFMRDRLYCPLEYDVSQKGYYYEDDTFTLPMVYLSAEELSSLLMARKILQDVSGGYLGDEISSILEKITNVLNKHMARGNQIDDAFSFQLIEYSPVTEQVFKAVLEACLKRNQLKFTYYSPARDEKSERTVDPYHLFNYMGTWHLIAYCHLRKSVRDFALGRITQAAILQENFERPSNFNMKDFFQTSFGIYKGKSIKDVTLRFSPIKSRWIRDQVWHKDQKTKVLEDGSLELTFPVADFSEIKMEILKHGDMVEVIKPKSLRELIKAEAKSIADIY
ncbi:MAG TPA: WYL domain-containing protein [Thermodesulfobacteriota bacterium]|nr:WYL domain-containing protein [Thermodesulfobacteriota bacterium]